MLCFQLMLITVTASGCIGGFPDNRPQPPGPWKGATSGLALPATRPMTGVARHPFEYAAGSTSVSPEQVIASARSIFEPSCGPMRYVRREIPNGRTGHLLLTPRYDVANLGQDYRWREVYINFNPADGVSSVDVRTVERFKRAVLFSIHGGPWLFPPAIAEERRGAEEHALVVAIMQRLDTPGGRSSSTGTP
jgi:hypothetical protein